MYATSKAIQTRCLALGDLIALYAASTHSSHLIAYAFLASRVNCSSKVFRIPADSSSFALRRFSYMPGKALGYELTLVEIVSLSH
jgi:hypothetical protein